MKKSSSYRLIKKAAKSVASSTLFICHEGSKQQKPVSLIDEGYRLSPVTKEQLEATRRKNYKYIM